MVLTKIQKTPSAKKSKARTLWAPKLVERTFGHFSLKLLFRQKYKASKLFILFYQQKHQRTEVRTHFTEKSCTVLKKKIKKRILNSLFIIHKINKYLVLLVKVHSAQKVVHTERGLGVDRKNKKIATVIVGHFSLRKSAE